MCGWNEPGSFCKGCRLNKLNFVRRGFSGEGHCVRSLLLLAGRECTVLPTVLMCQPGADWWRQFELDVDLTTAAESSSRGFFFFLSQCLASYLTLLVERFHCSGGNGITACRSRQTSAMNSSNIAELCFLFARRRASATSCSSLTSSSCCPPARAWAASYSRWAMPCCSSSSPHCTLLLRHTVDWLSGTLCGLKSDSWWVVLLLLIFYLMMLCLETKTDIIYPIDMEGYKCIYRNNTIVIKSSLTSTWFLPLNKTNTKCNFNKRWIKIHNFFCFFSQ